MKNILHLVLKKKWFDMIASGEKTVEYRKFSQYWIDRISGKKVVVFHLGYTRKIIIFELKNVIVHLKNFHQETHEDLRKPEWGFTEEDMFLLVLGKRLPAMEAVLL